MMQIKAVSAGFPDNPGAIAPATPIPVDAIAVVCDGSTYTVYEPGDTVPQPQESAAQ